jgi:hypothetical protein
MRWRLLLLLACSVLTAQDFTQRGFLETRGRFILKTAPNDSGHIVGDRCSGTSLAQGV